MALMCGICGAWAEMVSSGWLSERRRLEEHAWDEHRLSPADVSQARQDQGRWVLPDGRLWMWEIPDEALDLCEHAEDRQDLAEVLLEELARGDDPPTDGIPLEQVIAEREAQRVARRAAEAEDQLLHVIDELRAILGISAEAYEHDRTGSRHRSMHQGKVGHINARDAAALLGWLAEHPMEKD